MVPRNPILKAVWWVSKELDNGPRSCRDIEREAELAGISRKALHEAKRILRVESRPAGMRGPWIWSLPGGQSNLTNHYTFNGAVSRAPDQVRARTVPTQ